MFAECGTEQNRTTHSLESRPCLLNAEHSSGTFELQHCWQKCLECNCRLCSSEVKSPVTQNGICCEPLPLSWLTTNTIITFSTTLVTCELFYGPHNQQSQRNTISSQHIRISFLITHGVCWALCFTIFDQNIRTPSYTVKSYRRSSFINFSRFYFL